jgi:zinc protease
MSAGTAEGVRIDCDGVPFFWVEAPAPYRVALEFRVGRADESLPAAGVTHLCEHLALDGFQDATRSFNGRVELNRTSFFCQGTADESRHFLEETCRRLGNLPVDHLDHEKRILRTEAAGRSKGIVDAMLFDRFGAKHYGLGWFPEYGMWTVNGHALREWAARWFTRGNAAGWIVGPEPLRVELPLPAGDRMPPPTPAPLADTFPAVTRLPARIVGVAAVVPRSTAATLALTVMTGRLQQVLRFEMGAAYHVMPVYMPLTAGAAWLSMTSDLSDSLMKETVQRFVAVVQDVATRGPSEEELDRHRAASVASLDSHGWELSLADAAVFDELFGSVHVTRAGLRDTYLSVSVDRIREFAGSVVAGALYQVPPGLDVELDGIKPLSAWS